MSSRTLSFQGPARSLARVVTAASQVVATKGPRPILQNLLLEGGDGGALTVTGQDLNVRIRLAVPDLQVQEGGKVLVDAARLQHVLRELSEEEISLTAGDKGSCTISTEGAKIQVAGQDPADYPAPAPSPAPEGEPLVLEAARLARGLRRVRFAASAERGRHAMDGVLVEARDSKLSLVGTDGKRLALQEERLTKEAETLSTVIPLRAVEVLERVLRDTEEELKLKGDANHLRLEGESLALTATQVAGTYPPYRSVLPEPYEKQLSVDRKKMLRSLRRVGLLGSATGQIARFHFTANCLEMTGLSEVGESRILHPLAWEEEELEVGYNPHLLAEGLKAIDHDNVILEVQDARSPAIIRAEDEHGRFVYLMMPAKLETR